MKLPRDLSGQRLVKTLIAKWQCRQVNRVGSHIILQTEQRQHHRLSVPDHTPLRVGTLNAILRDGREPRTSVATKLLVRFELASNCRWRAIQNFSNLRDRAALATKVGQRKAAVQRQLVVDFPIATSQAGAVLRLRTQGTQQLSKVIC
jgi:predicted RNA binding protein YcfA (HicA-like mRNA interferase family)